MSNVIKSFKLLDLLSKESTDLGDTEGIFFLPQDAKAWRLVTEVYFYPKVFFEDKNYQETFVQFIKSNAPNYAAVSRDWYFFIVRLLGGTQENRLYHIKRLFIRDIKISDLKFEDVPEKIKINFPSKYLYQDNNKYLLPDLTAIVTFLVRIIRGLFVSSSNFTQSIATATRTSTRTATKTAIKTPTKTHTQNTNVELMSERHVILDSEGLAEHSVIEAVEELNALIKEKVAELQIIPLPEYGENEQEDQMILKLPSGEIVEIYNEQTWEEPGLVWGRATSAFIEYVNHYLSEYGYSLYMIHSESAYFLSYPERIKLQQDGVKLLTLQQLVSNKAFGDPSHFPVIGSFK